jgi:hypothetical protein
MTGIMRVEDVSRKIQEALLAGMEPGGPTAPGKPPRPSARKRRQEAATRKSVAGAMGTVGGPAGMMMGAVEMALPGMAKEKERRDKKAGIAQGLGLEVTPDMTRDDIDKMIKAHRVTRAAGAGRVRRKLGTAGTALSRGRIAHMGEDVPELEGPTALDSFSRSVRNQQLAERKEAERQRGRKTMLQRYKELPPEQQAQIEAGAGGGASRADLLKKIEGESAQQVDLLEQIRDNLRNTATIGVAKD